MGKLRRYPVMNFFVSCKKGNYTGKSGLLIS